MEKQKYTPKLSFLRVFVIVLTFTSLCGAINDGIGNPTVVPSSRRSGLHRSPNPIDNTSNLTVTGNVAGGRHFRGEVPYRSTTEFGDTLGSSSLSSFYRYSAPISRTSSRSSRSSLSPQPYYLPSSTVGQTSRSFKGRMDYSPSMITSRPKVTDKVGNIITRQLPPAVSPLYDYNKTRPLSFETSDLQRAVDYDLRQQTDKLGVSRAIRNIVSGNKLQKDTEPKETIKSPFKRIDPAALTDNTNITPEPAQRDDVTIKPAKSTTTKSVYEQILQQIQDSQAAVEPVPIDITQDQALAEIRDDADKEAVQPTDMKSEFSEISDETAGATMGVHKSFATDSQDKFNYYMRIAEDFLIGGKYYRAADAYTLASIYNPTDPLAYAGRSHALFASGEYMSSAYFLIKTIEMFPEYTKLKVDIATMIPDRDRLETRIADIKQWIEKNNSPELSLLLGYIYHQMSMDVLAVSAIDFAAEKLPNNSAVSALRETIKQQ